MTDKTGGAALEWLARNTDCELCHQYGEEGDEPDEWRVYRMMGNRSDREWKVIGRGATPLGALLSARDEG